MGDLFFYKMRLPSEEQPVLYVQEGIEGSPCVLIDPNRLSIDSPVSLSSFVPSPDGKWLAYGLAENGSDWMTWKILDVLSGKNLSDRLEKIKFFPVAWAPDCHGLYYSRLDQDDVYRVYYHALGTEQDSDSLIYENLTDPELFSVPFISSDHSYLMINLVIGSSGPNGFLYRPVDQPQAPFKMLIPTTENKYSFICNEGSIFYFWTNQDAPLGKLIAFDAQNKTQKEIIPESHFSLDHVYKHGNYFIADFSEHANSRVAIYDCEGLKIRDIQLPRLGTVGLSPSPLSYSDKENELFFSFTHFVQPPVIYRYNIETDLLKVFKKTPFAI